jgi:predicted DNA-binding protein
MRKNYTRLLVTKLSPSIHDRLKELAIEDRRTLSGLSRIIIEDYIAQIPDSERRAYYDKT